MRRIVSILILSIIIFCAGDAKMATMQKEEKLNLIPDPQWETLGQWESGDKNYETNKILNALTNAALLADWYLTSEGIKKGGTEANPILGHRPTQEQIGLYFLSIILGNHMLPQIIGSDYADIMRSHLLAAEIPCLESWIKPNYDWNKVPSWKITIPFKF